MQIKSIIRSQTILGERVVFRTEPPLSKEVFDLFQQRVKDSRLSVENGCLSFTSSSTPDKEFLQEMQKVLTESEEVIRGQHQHLQEQAKKDFDKLSSDSGLPLED